MSRRRRLSAGLAMVSACLLALVAAAPAAKAPVASGDYKGIPVLEQGGVYETAYFSVLRKDGKRKIVATEEFATQGILYPDPGECDDGTIPLTAEQVPVNGLGRFKVRDRTVLDDLVVNVTWTGRWKNAKRVVGKVRIRSGECTTSAQWSARRIAKPG